MSAFEIRFGRSTRTQLDLISKNSVSNINEGVKDFEQRVEILSKMHDRHSKMQKQGKVLILLNSIRSLRVKSVKRFRLKRLFNG